MNLILFFQRRNTSWPILKFNLCTMTDFQLFWLFIIFHLYLASENKKYIFDNFKLYNFKQKPFGITLRKRRFIAMCPIKCLYFYYVDVSHRNISLQNVHSSTVHTYNNNKQYLPALGWLSHVLIFTTQSIRFPRQIPKSRFQPYVARRWSFGQWSLGDVAHLTRRWRSCLLCCHRGQGVRFEIRKLSHVS